MPDIQVTDEMIAAYVAASDPWADPDERAEARIAAVLRIIDHDVRVPLLALIRDLVDGDACWFDHHGGCQAHGYLSLKPGRKCPHAEAKELLAAQGGGDRE